MKQLYSFVFTILMYLCYGNTWAQCPTGNLHLNSQQDIIDFVAQYPNCTEIGGNVYISTSEVNDLSPLIHITSIDKGLYIRNTHIIDLTGLNNLTSVSSLLVGGNDALVNLTGLESLETANSVSIGDYSIETFLPNNALTSLTGLNNLTSVEWLGIMANPVLTDMTSLNTLDSIQYLQIYENSSLVNLNGLGNLSSVEHLIILSNTSLTDLTALENLTSAVSELYITHNDNLSDLSGLQNIDYNTAIGLGIFKNPMLSFCNLPNICDYLENGGTSDIHDNAPNCNTSEEVLDACDALPIETLDKLQVYLKNKTAILEWRTATETNNAGFEIQRSKDGITWEKIAWQEGQGNTLTPQAYTYRDENPFFGTSYYRFKQVDFNGDFSYSNVVSLQYIRSGITVFPNPNTGIFEVQSTAEGTYQILNTSGQVIQIGNMKNDISLDISDTAQGVYFISVTIDKETFVKRIIKM